MEENTKHITSLKDPQMSNGIFIIWLCAAIEPRAVNWEIVNEGKTDKDKIDNAKYAISVARKLGAVMVCVWEDIVKVNDKQMLTLFSCLHNIFD